MAMGEKSPRGQCLGLAVFAAALLASACGPSGPGNDAPPLVGGSPVPVAGVQSGSPTPTPTPTPTPVPSGACTPTIGASTAPATQVQHLGTLRVGDTVPFTVPPGTVSVTIVEQVESAPQTINDQPPGSQFSFTVDNTAVPLKVRDARGVTLYDDTAATNASDPAGLIAGRLLRKQLSGDGTLTIPNTSAALAMVAQPGLAAGTWSMTVSDYAYECTLPHSAGSSCSGGSATSTYDVTVITKPAPGGAIPAIGTIDVAIYFATTSAGSLPGLSAATANAGGDPDLNRMGQALRALLHGAGLTVGSLTYHDLPPAVVSANATGVDLDQTGACSALSALLRNADAGNRLNVFFVSTFTSSFDQGVNQVVGIDGTIPGPATFGGTGASGAAVATHDLRAGRANCTGTALSLLCGADVTAYIIAHEAGHFLGLYHVTEAEGASFDPLQDTPACPCRTCAPVASQGAAPARVRPRRLRTGWPSRTVRSPPPAAAETT